MGSLSRWTNDGSGNNSWCWWTWTFAGNTAIKRAMMPQAASLEYLGASSKMPRTISITPLAKTSVR